MYKRQVLHWIEGQLKPEKFMILGYSMGAIVTSVLCHEVPLEGILLWSPCSEPYGNFRHLLGQEIFEEGLRGNDVDFMGDLVPHEFFVGLDAPEIDPLAAIRDFKKPLRPVSYTHLDVYKRQGEDRVHCRPAVFSGFHLSAQKTQHFHGYLPVDFVVLCHQDPQSGKCFR